VVKFNGKVIKIELIDEWVDLIDEKKNLTQRPQRRRSFTEEFLNKLLSRVDMI